MFTEKIKELQDQIDEKRSMYNKDLDKAQEFVKDDKFEEARSLQAKLEPAKKEIEELESRMDDVKSLKEQADAEKRNKKPATVDTGDGKQEQGTDKRALLNNFIHTKQEVRDAAPADNTNGLKSADIGVLIPEDISYTPQETPQTVVDLRQYVHVVPVSHQSGNYPILGNPTDVVPTVAELEKNPALAKPNFTQVKWEVATHRGAIALAQESIDDSEADLTGIVIEDTNKKVLNTSNADISAVIKTFAAKAATSLDDIKTILNVSLDPAYNQQIVASQSFYNMVDQMKDGQGRYLLTPDVRAQSGYSLLGRPVSVVNDNLLGAAGEAHAFIGDLQRAVLYLNRAQVGLRWVDDSILGQYLGVAFRYGVAKADENAGFFVTLTEPASK